MAEKLDVLVRVDLEGAHVQITVQGRVTEQSVQALYVVVKRANALMRGLEMEIDLTRASVAPAALDQLRAYSESRHLPAHIDPLQADCRLSVLAPAEVLTAAGNARLAA